MGKIRATFFGKKVILNMFDSHGVRLSPGANARARAIGKCATGKPLAARKECFEGNKIKGK